MTNDSQLERSVPIDAHSTIHYDIQPTNITANDIWSTILGRLAVVNLSPMLYDKISCRILGMVPRFAQCNPSPGAIFLCNILQSLMRFPSQKRWANGIYTAPHRDTNGFIRHRSPCATAIVREPTRRSETPETMSATHIAIKYDTISLYWAILNTLRYTRTA